MNVEDRLRDAFGEAAQHVQTSEQTAWAEVADRVRTRRAWAPSLRWRRLVPLVTAIAAVAAVLAIGVISGDGDSVDPKAAFPQGEGRRLVPGGAPQGMTPFRLETSPPWFGGSNDTVAVFGTAGDEESLTGTVVLASPTEPRFVTDHPGRTEIAGRTAAVDSDDTPAVSWLDGDGAIDVRGYGIDVEGLRSLVGRIRLDADGRPVGDGLPDGVVEIGRLERDWCGDETRVTVSFAVGPINPTELPGNTIGEFAEFDTCSVEPAEVVALHALLGRDPAYLRTFDSVSDDVIFEPIETVEVEGRTAWAGTLSGTARALIVPGEPGAALVSRENFGGVDGKPFLSNRQLITFAEMLTRVDDDELRRRQRELTETEIARAREAFVADFGPVVWEGEVDGYHRMLLARGREGAPQACLATVAIERFHGPQWSCVPTRDPMTVGNTDLNTLETNRYEVWGAVDETVAAVEIRVPGREPIRPELHRTEEGPPAAVFLEYAGEDAEPTGMPTGVVVIAYDASGEDVARVTSDDVGRFPGER